ncbi:MAG: hypothetical protein FWD65_04955 [Coriobacteriia bacterium]|nr:hypothetical protein [Coriobacteriia bacterium]
MRLQYDDLIERLRRLDEDAVLTDDSDFRYVMVIVGGERLFSSDDEAKASALSMRRHKEFLYSYQEYVKKNRP